MAARRGTKRELRGRGERGGDGSRALEFSTVAGCVLFVPHGWSAESGRGWGGVQKNTTMPNHMIARTMTNATQVLEDRNSPVPHWTGLFHSGHIHLHRGTTLSTTVGAHDNVIGCTEHKERSEGALPELRCLSDGTSIDPEEHGGRRPAHILSLLTTGGKRKETESIIDSKHDGRTGE